MFARALRACHRRAWPAQRSTRFIRKYDGNAGHTTYFQQPPPAPRKWPRRLAFVLWSTTCIGLGAYGMTRVALEPVEALFGAELGDSIHNAIATAAFDAIAKGVPPLSLEEIDELLRSKSGYSVNAKVVAHTCQAPSNMPCEDNWSAGGYTLLNDPQKDWSEWAIFDGHAGSRTAEVLKKLLAVIVGERLWEAQCMQRPYVPNDPHVIATIKKAFLELDKDILETAAERIRSGGPLSDVVSAASAAFSGSCALLALYDPLNSVLRVCNVGDSRAVLGRWDQRSGKYVAVPMSVDQTGFNQEEVSRLQEEHPGEENIVDPNSGRVHGIAISRAFGDARWKWTNEVNKKAQERYFGPTPRPDSMIKTPPYLTAEPEIMETRISTNKEHPDFLIMASDGLWDQMSSEDAVECVQLWLNKNKPSDFLEAAAQGEEQDSWKVLLQTKPPVMPVSAPTFSSASDLSDDDTYIAEDGLKWRTSPKHFVNEDENAGIHLVKNALGGKRRDLFTGVMSVQPPLSRNVRDDITCHVIFFGQDTDPVVTKAMNPDHALAR